MSCKTNLRLTFLLVPQGTILAMRRAVAIVAATILIGLATPVSAAPPPQSVVSKIFSNPKPGVG